MPGGRKTPQNPQIGNTYDIFMAVPTQNNHWPIKRTFIQEVNMMEATACIYKEFLPLSAHVSSLSAIGDERNRDWELQESSSGKLWGFDGITVQQVHIVADLELSVSEHYFPCLLNMVKTVM